jgi:hypothetical protein
MVSLVARGNAIITNLFAQFARLPGAWSFALDRHGAHQTGKVTEFAFFRRVFHLVFAAKLHACETLVRASARWLNASVFGHFARRCLNSLR